MTKSVLPSGWSVVLLESVAHVQTGLSKSENRTGPSFRRPYLRVANVQDGYLDLTEIKEIDIPRGQQGRHELQHSDVLLTEGGDFDKLGRGCIWTSEIPVCVHQNHIFAVRVTRSDMLLPQFLACVIQSSYSKSYFLACAKQTTNLASINSSQLRKLPLILPPLDEQRQLVDKLTDWDKCTDKLREIIAAKERARRGLMQRLLRHKSPLMKIGSFVERVTRQNVNGVGIPLTVSGRNGLISQLEFYDKRIASELAHHYTLLKRGEFAYNRSYSSGYPYGAIKRLDAYDEGIVSSLCLCFALVPDAPMLSDYFLSFCEMGGFNHQIHMIAQEGARNHGLLNVATNDFFAMKVPVPPVPEQTRVVEVLAIAAREIHLLRERLERLKKQKRGLMQKLLTGTWRVCTNGLGENR